MNDGSAWVGRALFVAQVGIVGAFALGSTGCGALAAMANPKAAWAFNEPAPMGVVVRRAEVASATADQVERLMARTGVDDGSKWIPKTAIAKADAEAMLGEVGTHDTYAAAGGQKIRVVSAEAWVETFSSICSSESKYPSLIAATSPALASSFGEISALDKEIATLKSDKAAEEKALDAKGISESDKTAHEKKRDELDESISKKEDDYKPKREAFIAKVKEEAAKADDATKKRIGVALINLKRAVDDAKLDNSVALLRYPMAVSGLPDDLQSSAKRVVADVIEEKTGKRPDMSGLKPDVKLEGTDVKVTLNGLSASELASMSPEEVLEETTSRLGGYATRVLALMAYADATQQRLSFEGDVLEAWIAGFSLDASKVEGAGDDLSELKVETSGKKAKTDDAKPRVAGTKHTAGGLRTTSCKLAKKEPEEVAAKEEEPKDAKKADKSASKSKEKPQKSASMASASKSTPASSPNASAKTTSTVPAATQTPAAAPASMAPTGTKCDIVVTNGDGTTCL